MFQIIQADFISHRFHQMQIPNIEDLRPACKGSKTESVSGTIWGGTQCIRQLEDMDAE
jgi:hypothetical protein